MLIGNLGADAQVQNVNGSSFVTFRVACTEKIRRGDTIESVTTWYSCSYNRADSPVIQYLRQGTQVFIIGRPEYAIYDSAKYHRKMIDVRVYVNTLQLCGSSRDSQQDTDEPQPF
jgi:Single-stranded DNA-binding protein